MSMRMAGGEMRMVRRHGALLLLLLLAGFAVAWNPTPHHEMAPCYPTEQETCQFIPGSKTTWDADARTYTESEDGGYGAPLWDSIDTEWSQKFVDNLRPGGQFDIQNAAILREAIVNGDVRIGRKVDDAFGSGDLTLPVPGNHPPGSEERAMYSQPASNGKAFGGNEEYLKMLHPDHKYTRTITLTSGSEEYEVGPIDMVKAMRSGGFPMCPNYWDWFDKENPGPLNLGNDDTQDGELYKFPAKVVGSPLIGDPELHFCRKWQEKYDATCCTTYLDEDIQEEYEELTGSGYLGAHVFVQQFLCLPCHPMISCMIDESSDTLRIPLKFAQKLADKMEDFDRTGLKVKVGEHDDNLGPLRQDEHFVPSQHFARQRGTHGAPAPPFPIPNCASKFGDDGMFPGVPETGDNALGYWAQADCTFDATENPTFNPIEEDENGEPGECEGDQCGMLFEPDLVGRCECTGPGKHCSCIREFLMHLRPPGINGYDGLDLNIEIVDDDSCGVLYDLMAGSTTDPLLDSPASNGALGSGERLSLSVLTAGMALTVLPLVGGAIR